MLSSSSASKCVLFSLWRDRSLWASGCRVSAMGIRLAPTKPPSSPCTSKAPLMTDDGTWWDASWFAPTFELGIFVVQVV